jgi:hypothetical protein
MKRLLISLLLLLSLIHISSAAYPNAPFTKFNISGYTEDDATGIFSYDSTNDGIKYTATSPYCCFASYRGTLTQTVNITYAQTRDVTLKGTALDLGMVGYTYNNGIETSNNIIDVPLTWHSFEYFPVGVQTWSIELRKADDYAYLTSTFYISDYSNPKNYIYGYVSDGNGTYFQNVNVSIIGYGSNLTDVSGYYQLTANSDYRGKNVTANKNGIIQNETLTSSTPSDTSIRDPTTSCWDPGLLDYAPCQIASVRQDFVFTTAPIITTLTTISDCQASQNTIYSLSNQAFILICIALMVFGFGFIIHGFNGQNPKFILGGIIVVIVGFAMILLGSYLIANISAEITSSATSIRC